MPRALCALAMTHFTRGAVVNGGGLGQPAPTEAQQEVQWAGDRKGRPYGSVTRSAVGRANVRHRPLRMFFQIKKENAGGVLLTV